MSARAPTAERADPTPPSRGRPGAAPMRAEPRAVCSADAAAARARPAVRRSASTSSGRSFKRPFQLREFIEQAWFIASVTLLPTALVSIPFGAVISLQVGNLTRQLGAQSFTGAAAVLAVVREAARSSTALLIAGAAGSAICADLGARKIREEIDAMEVLGIDPLAAAGGAAGARD